MSYIIFMFTYRFRSFLRSSSWCFKRLYIEYSNVLVNITITYDKSYFVIVCFLFY